MRFPPIRLVCLICLGSLVIIDNRFDGRSRLVSDDCCGTAAVPLANLPTVPKLVDPLCPSKDVLEDVDETEFLLER